MELDNQIAVKHFQNIEKQLFEIRIVLLPRALTLSNSQELRASLHRFEDVLLSYEDILVVKTKRATTSNLIDILIEASNVYDALMKEHQKEMSSFGTTELVSEEE